MSAITQEIRERASAKGFEGLLDYFERQVTEHRRFGKELTPRADQENINFKTGNETYITIQWRYRSGADGLHVGVRNDLKGQGGCYLYNFLPAPENPWARWVYSMFGSSAEIDEFLRKA